MASSLRLRRPYITPNMTRPSETAPLLGSYEPKPSDHEDRFRDRPIHLNEFKRNVRICKAFLGVLLPLYLSLEVLHLVSHHGLGDTYESMDVIGSGVTVVLTVSPIMAELTLVYPAGFLHPHRLSTHPHSSVMQLPHRHPRSQAALHLCHLSLLWRPLLPPPYHLAQHLLCLFALYAAPARSGTRRDVNAQVGQAGCSAGDLAIGWPRASRPAGAL